MLIALLSAPLVLAGPADPDDWKPLESGELGTAVWRPLEGEDGASRQLVVRLTLAEPREWTMGENVYELDCQARTLTMLSVAVFRADGSEIQSMTIPPEERRPQPMYAGPGFQAVLYPELCPGGPPLEERPPTPSIVPVSPS